MRATGLTEPLPASLHHLYLPEHIFSQRFEVIHQIEDPYVRVYEISRDQETGGRVAVRSYTALEGSQEHDVLENMESFRKLGDQEGMCRLIAFTKKQTGGIISAAFEYTDFSLEELLESRQYYRERYQLYLLVLKGLMDIVASASNSGIVIEEIIPACILLQTVGADFRLKILYDEREKRYEKIQEGMKVLASPEKMATVINEMRDYESSECEEAVFQLGLLLLDFIFEFQQRSSASPDDLFSKDSPIRRNNLSHKGYLLFQHYSDRSVVELNQPLIDQKVAFLTALGVPYINQLIALATQMIAPLATRISFEKAYEESQHFSQAMLQASNEVTSNLIIQPQFTFATPPKEPYKESIALAKESITLENDNRLNGLSPELKNVVSQSTIAQTYPPSTTDHLPKQELISDTRVIEIVIPREALLSKARKCSSLLGKLEEFVSRLQDRPGIIRKEYLDGNVFYGCLNGNGKREGPGIYVYSSNDIYFGAWKDNLLVEGNYIFQNGESFEGVVKNGKQGFGRYCYANGNVYEGEWRDDVKHGGGRMKYPNGDLYDGMWSKGKKNGQGKYSYANGISYVGNFVDGRKNGFGEITFPNGTKVEAYWNQTHIEGPGKVFYSNGNYFEGNYHMSQKEGRGFFRWEDTEYQGEFKKDLMEGHARIRFSEAEYYQGRIKNGKRDGKGLYRYANGDQFSGDWKNDEKMMGNYRFHEGGSFEGRFKNNELSYGIMVYENGQSYEGEFLRGERHGLGIYKGIKGEQLFQGKWQRDQFLAAL